MGVYTCFFWGGEGMTDYCKEEQRPGLHGIMIKALSLVTDIQETKLSDELCPHPK